MKVLIASTEQLLASLHEQLAQVKTSHPTPLLQSKAAIPVCLEHVRLLRRHLKTIRNIPKEQEIHFFKHIKPQFVSEYYFNVMVYRLHYAWPMGDTKTQQHYLEEGLLQLKLFFEKNLHFCCYYRTNSAYLDNIYFVRGQHDIEPCPDHLLCGTDPGFHTPRDLMQAQILANDQYQHYLQDQLDALLSGQSSVTKGTKPPVLVWSESKSAFMELIYGLHLSRALNNGSCEIKTIVSVLGKAFGMELKNIYDYIYHIKMRKLEPTKFTDKMKTCLLQNFSEQVSIPDNSSHDQL